MGRETQLPKKDGANQPDNLPLYLFRNGTNRRAYEYLACTRPPIWPGVHGGPGVGPPCQGGLPGGQFLQLG